MDEEYITVSQLTNYIKEKIADDSNLRSVYIKGELSNAKLYNSGHFYFTLKDDSSQIKGVMFAAKYKLKFRPKNGMEVLIKGKVDVYHPYGTYQLYADSISQFGIGQLHIEFEQLKEKLSKEGLFDDEHKKKIPQFPEKIGVVTAANGAAIKDIITTINRRWPICEVILFPSLVQGETASTNIVNQIRNADEYGLDTLIVGRGGGNIEDLWSFNEENVARAIYDAKTPIISAVGHEIDFTISDFVADLRAPTPTAAAEMVTPNISEIKSYLNHFESNIAKLVIRQFEDNKTTFTNIVNSDLFKNPHNIHQSKEIMLDDLVDKLDYLSRNIILSNRNKLNVLKNSYCFKNPRVLFESNGLVLDDLVDKLDYLSKNIISENRNKLNVLKNSYCFKNPNVLFELKEVMLEDLISKLDYSSKNIISENRNKLEKLKNNYYLINPYEIVNKKREEYCHQFDKLEVLNPLNTLKRGYTLTKLNGKVVSSSKNVKNGDVVEIEFRDGIVNAKLI